MDFSEQLLRQLAIDATGGTPHHGDLTLDFSSLRRMTMREAVIEYWDGDNPPAIDDVCDPRMADRQNRQGHRRRSPRAALRNRTPNENSFSPRWSTNSPSRISPLANSNPDDPTMVDRFEIFIAGMEIGNAFTELNNPIPEQCLLTASKPSSICANATLTKPTKWTKTTYRALSYGMPPTAGEGLGIDRLTMLLTNSQSIRDVILFHASAARRRNRHGGKTSPPRRGN